MQAAFKKIIEKLEEKQDIFLYEDSDYGEGKYNAFDEAIEIVKQEAEKYNNGWIPVSERLPEEHITKDGHVDPSEEVLVYIYYGENCVSNGCGVSRYWEHTKFHKNPWIDLECGKENVVAWQPLPPEYQPKGE